MQYVVLNFSLLQYLALSLWRGKSLYCKHGTVFGVWFLAGFTNLNERLGITLKFLSRYIMFIASK